MSNSFDEEELDRKEEEIVEEGYVDELEKRLASAEKGELQRIEKATTEYAELRQKYMVVEKRAEKADAIIDNIHEKTGGRANQIIRDALVRLPEVEQRATKAEADLMACGDARGLEQQKFETRIRDLEKELAELKIVQQKDYDGMRSMQMKFIEADHKCADLENRVQLAEKVAEAFRHEGCGRAEIGACGDEGPETLCRAHVALAAYDKAKKGDVQHGCDDQPECCNRKPDEPHTHGEGSPK